AAQPSHVTLKHSHRSSLEHLIAAAQGSVSFCLSVSSPPSTAPALFSGLTKTASHNATSDKQKHNLYAQRRE
ncbi:hypothetical protein BIW11_08180, partial [Tropilaelaps mercedesae]